MRVLGVDPSSQATGYGVLELKDGRYSVLGHGAIKPRRAATLPEKLLEIKGGIERLIGAFDPEDVAVENPFVGRNIKTALTLGQVRGAVLVAVAERGRALYEYSPLEIKKAVTGYGQADKPQVATMVKALLGLEDEALGEDAADALACALCHLATRSFKRLVEESAG